MKATIIGAGAIGGWMAGLLSDAGWDVSLLARGATLATIRDQGLRLRRGEEEKRYRLAASDDPAALPKPDYAIVAVKGHNVPEIAPALSAMCGPDTAVVTALNGIPWWFFQVPGVPLSGLVLESVDPGGIVARAIPIACVIGCVVHASAWTPEPGIVELNKADMLVFGEPDGGRSARCVALCTAFQGCEAKAVESTQIRHDIWLKLWGNMSMNPLSVLAEAQTDAILDDPELRALVAAMMTEMQALGEKVGLPIEMAPEERMAVTRRLGSFKTSMLRDWEAGRPLEIAPLLGALVETASRVDAPMPFTRSVLDLITQRLRGGT
jgi:2-dehydropantoate 2-reductase